MTSLLHCVLAVTSSYRTTNQTVSFAAAMIEAAAGEHKRQRRTVDIPVIGEALGLLLAEQDLC